MKTFFIFFTSLLYFNCFAQSDTVYIDDDPIYVEQKVYYVKPKDTINIKNEVRILSLLNFKQELEYTDGEYNNVTIQKSNQLIEELELGLFKKKKKTYYGIGAGLSQNNYSFTQQAFSTTSIDSVKNITIDIITIDSIETFITDTLGDTTFLFSPITDTVTTETWETTETEQEQSSKSIIKTRYAFIPIYLGVHFDKGKFSFNILAFLKTYFLVSRTGNINLISKGDTKTIINNQWIKKMYWQYGGDFSISYKITKNINIIANTRINGIKHSSLNLESNKKYLKLNLGLGTSIIF